MFEDKAINHSSRLKVEKGEPIKCKMKGLSWRDSRIRRVGSETSGQSLKIEVVSSVRSSRSKENSLNLATRETF